MEINRRAFLESAVIFGFVGAAPQRVYHAPTLVEQCVIRPPAPTIGAFRIAPATLEDGLPQQRRD